MKKTLLQSYCSLFPTYYSKKLGRSCFSTKPQTVAFSDLINHPDPEQLALKNKIRSLAYKCDEQSALKPSVWGITPSSIQLKGRGEDFHVLHTGFMAFDIDGLESGLDKAFEIVKLIAYVTYCSRSIRGQGLWGLMKISDPDMHKEHFNAMEAAFKAMGIKIDTAPRNVASLRFMSFDADGYYNENAEIFDKKLETVLPPKREFKKYESNGQKGNDNTDVKQLIEGFNSSCTAQDMHDILINFGFNYHSTSGSRYRFTRPGKDTKAGLSVDYHEDRRTLYSFSSEVPLLDKWKAESDKGWSCSPMTALLLYGFGGMEKQHWAQAFSYLKNK
ncbi:BT4734/BF3469 family protein [Arcticibacter eurypsychrophilus]|uniref:BT4734/BF3469 family protein n=1 Tax=Arcticibacter eurypsychrophilus TaxID=1434752 RepID=UPI00084DF6D4|nr:BT4734/BF3469 family protein [Arcticibacter eurypsychrophilus]